MGPRHSLLLGCGLMGQAFLSVSSSYLFLPVHVRP